MHPILRGAGEDKIVQPIGQEGVELMKAVLSVALHEVFGLR